MRSKIIFMDIDGTIWDRTNFIPESTKEAIRLLKLNGHKVFICTGRTMGYVTNPDLLGLNFDGIVSGCGTMITIGDETKYYKELDQDLMVDTLKSARENGIRPILEGRKYLYMDREDFGEDPYGQKLFAELGERALPITGHHEGYECSKFSCDMTGGNKEAFYAHIEENYDILEHNPYIAEFVPKGHSKGTGVIATCEMLGFDVNDSIAIGDGANDIDMFKAAGIAICMGNGADIAKKNADYITTDLRDDGIYNALRHFELI